MPYSVGQRRPKKNRRARCKSEHLFGLWKNAVAAPRWESIDNASHYLMASGSESLTRYDLSANRNNAPRCHALARACLLAQGLVHAARDRQYAAATGVVDIY